MYLPEMFLSYDQYKQFKMTLEQNQFNREIEQSYPEYILAQDAYVTEEERWEELCQLVNSQP